MEGRTEEKEEEVYLVRAEKEILYVAYGTAEKLLKSP
jgi:hypothetical protein